VAESVVAAMSGSDGSERSLIARAGGVIFSHDAR
jgi:hypothetical protein